MKERPSNRAIWAINMRFLQSAIGAAIAWFCWPETPEAWGFGILSILMGLGAFGHFIGTIAIIRDHLRRDRTIADYARQGERPKGDHLATTNAQRSSGMVD